MSPQTQYRLYGRRFYRSKDPTNSIKVLKEHKSTQITQKYKTHSKSPSPHKYGVRGWLPQRAGSPSLNCGGTAAAVPREKEKKRTEMWWRRIIPLAVCYLFLMPVQSGGNFPHVWWLVTWAFRAERTWWGVNGIRCIHHCYTVYINSATWLQADVNAE